MNPETVEELQFDLDILVRYHDLRRAFFAKLNYGVPIITLLGMFVAGFGFSDSNTVLGLVGLTIILVITTLNLALGRYEGCFQYGFAGHVSFHDRLYHESVDLSAEVVGTIEPTVELFHKWSVRMSRIVNQDTRKFRAAYAFERNIALYVAERDDEKVHLTWWQTMFMNLFRFSETHFSQARDAVEA